MRSAVEGAANATAARGDSTARVIFEFDGNKAALPRAGRLTALGVLTDTDNTGAGAEALCGDIRFLPAPD